MSDANEEWVEREAPRLVARARQEALHIAEERLRDRLVEALVRAAERPRASRSPTPPASTGDDAALWVYGIVRSRGTSLDMPGVDDREVELVTHGDLAALASEVPLERFGEEPMKAQLEDMQRLESLARAHDRVLNAALDTGDVVPFRLCTIYRSRDRLHHMLERDGAALAAALDAVRGKTEWSVKAWLDPSLLAASEPVAEVASGADYLARKRERRATAEAVGDAVDATVAELHARLGERATAAVLSRPQDRKLSGRDEEMVLNGSYLLPREDVERFTALVDELAERHRADGLMLEVTGPWPPYHFVEVPQA